MSKVQKEGKRQSKSQQLCLDHVCPIFQALDSQSGPSLGRPVPGTAVVLSEDEVSGWVRLSIDLKFT